MSSSRSASPIRSRIEFPGFASICATTQSRFRAMREKRLSRTVFPTPLSPYSVIDWASRPACTRAIAVAHALNWASRPTRAAGGRPAPGEYGFVTGSMRHLTVYGYLKAYSELLYSAISRYTWSGPHPASPTFSQYESGRTISRHEDQGDGRRSPDAPRARWM